MVYSSTVIENVLLLSSNWKKIDKPKRLDFSSLSLVQISLHKGWLGKICWTNEAHFLLNGCVNPLKIAEQGLNVSKVWLGFSTNFIIGTFFIFLGRGLNGVTKTVSITVKYYLDKFCNIMNLMDHLHTLTIRFFKQYFANRVNERQRLSLWNLLSWNL